MKPKFDDGQFSNDKTPKRKKVNTKDENARKKTKIELRSKNLNKIGLPKNLNHIKKESSESLVGNIYLLDNKPMIIKKIRRIKLKKRNILQSVQNKEINDSSPKSPTLLPNYTIDKSKSLIYNANDMNYTDPNLAPSISTILCYVLQNVSPHTNKKCCSIDHLDSLLYVNQIYEIFRNKYVNKFAHSFYNPNPNSLRSPFNNHSYNITNHLPTSDECENELASQHIIPGYDVKGWSIDKDFPISLKKVSKKVGRNKNRSNKTDIRSSPQLRPSESSEYKEDSADHQLTLLKYHEKCEALEREYKKRDKEWRLKHLDRDRAADNVVQSPLTVHHNEGNVDQQNETFLPNYSHWPHIFEIRMLKLLMGVEEGSFDSKGKRGLNMEGRSCNIPLTAFGRQIPIIAESDFILPSFT
ncbi:unnamed protein product [Gordionus sp. m RMFG-2023]|uniref:uncharacterized protein LOC135927292 n=1 Tax=Gordionus sp. m RMFG-2023 TaxID=3053472 RepID=UPI0030E58D6D